MMIAELSKIIKQHRVPLLVLLATWGVYFTYFFAHAVEMRPDGLYAGHENIWSDWALHVSIVNTFAHKPVSEWFAYHPIYAGGKFTYAFLSNLISALLMRLGMPLAPAMNLPSIVICWFLLVGMYLVAVNFLKSRGAALLTVFLYLLSSSPGFMDYFSDLFSNFSWAKVFFPPRDYSKVDSFGWLAGNVMVGHIVPQRNFLLGMTFGLWAIFGLMRAVENDSSNRKLSQKWQLLSAVLIGLLPVTHMHTLIALIAPIGLFCLEQWRKRKLLLHFVIPGFLLSAALYLIFIAGGIEKSGFIRFFPGWTAEGKPLTWIWLWLKIWGALIPVALAGLYFYVRDERDRDSKVLLIGLGLTFVLANLVLFQPITWDNAKLFFWANFGFCALAAYALSRLVLLEKPVLNFLAIVTVVTFTLSGVLEATRLIQIDQHTWQMTSSQNIALGEEVREKTGSRDIFLTAPEHNHWVAMWAVRPVLLGYTAWVWNYGFNHTQRETDVGKMFRGEPGADELLKKYSVRYVVIGPGELRNMAANEGYYQCRFAVRFQNPEYRVYDLSEGLPNARSCP